MRRKAIIKPKEFYLIRDGHCGSVFLIKRKPKWKTDPGFSWDADLESWQGNFLHEFCEDEFERISGIKLGDTKESSIIKVKLEVVA